jgi:tetratricopeptide (TPR) repeat protein
VRVARALLLVAGAGAAALALAGCGTQTVVRIVDGKPEEGRFISPAAYAYYARGADAQARGDLGGAQRAFELAIAHDPASPEIWTRLGALRCATAPPPGVPRNALLAFERAGALDPGSGPLHRELARCLLARGDASSALVEAERALSLDPDDLATALVRADALERTGRLDDARWALRATAARRPTAAEPWLALLALARRTDDDALAREAEGHVAERGGVVRDPSPLAAVDAALQAGDLAGAQRRALQARLPGAEVALRAAAMGRAALAREQAALVLGADPADASARIALAAAADLAGDEAALGEAMRAIPRRVTPPSRLGRLLFAEVLGRRVGPGAARAWLGPEVGPGSKDPLLAATEARVRGTLAVP